MFVKHDRATVKKSKEHEVCQDLEESSGAKTAGSYNVSSAVYPTVKFVRNSLVVHRNRIKACHTQEEEKDLWTDVQHHGNDKSRQEIFSRSGRVGLADFRARVGSGF